jgi:hypothetical protein
MSYLQVGKHISSGNYKVTLNAKLNSKEKIICFIFNKKMDRTIDQYEFINNNDSFEINLSNKQIVYIYRESTLMNNKSKFQLKFKRI